MKQFVITPFYPYAKTPLNDEVLFSRECDVLNYALNNLSSFLIPSLENQTIKDFTILLGINESLNELRPDIYAELIHLKNKVSFQMEVMDWFKYYDYIDKHNDNEIIATRIDHDDCLCKVALEKIREQQNWNLDFKFFAFMSGCMLWTDTGVIRRYVSDTWRDGVSSFSASPTFLTKWNVHRILPVYGHTRLTSITEPNHIEIIHNVNHFYDYDTEMAWLYVRHGYNRSREMWYKYEEQLDLTKEYVKDWFGIDVKPSKPVNME